MSEQLTFERPYSEVRAGETVVAYLTAAGAQCSALTWAIEQEGFSVVVLPSLADCERAYGQRRWRRRTLAGRVRVPVDEMRGRYGGGVRK